MIAVVSLLSLAVTKHNLKTNFDEEENGAGTGQTPTINNHYTRYGPETVKLFWDEWKKKE